MRDLIHPCKLKYDFSKLSYVDFFQCPWELPDNKKEEIKKNIKLFFDFFKFGNRDQLWIKEDGELDWSLVEEWFQNHPCHLDDKTGEGVKALFQAKHGGIALTLLDDVQGEYSLTGSFYLYIPVNIYKEDEVLHCRVILDIRFYGITSEPINHEDYESNFKNQILNIRKEYPYGIDDIEEMWLGFKDIRLDRKYLQIEETTQEQNEFIQEVMDDFMETFKDRHDCPFKRLYNYEEDSSYGYEMIYEMFINSHFPYEKLKENKNYQFNINETYFHLKDCVKEKEEDPSHEMEGWIRFSITYRDKTSGYDRTLQTHIVSFEGIKCWPIYLFWRHK